MMALLQPTTLHQNCGRLMKNTKKLSFLRVFLINQAFLFYFIGRASCIKLRTVFSLLN